MKRVVTIMIGFVTSLGSFAQLSIGVQGTGNLSDAEMEASYLITPKKYARTLPGGGIVADVKLSPALTVRTGVNYLQHGTTLKSSFDGGEFGTFKVESKLNLHYIQVPVNLLFTTQGPVSFFAGGGPYISYAASGRSKTITTATHDDGTSQSETEKENVFKKDADGNRLFKRTDFGVGALAGIKLPGGLFASIGYQFSLSNISDSDENKYKNRGLQLSVGYYLFGR